MKRLVTTIAVVLCLVGCGPSAGSLLTFDSRDGLCFLASVSGRLVVDVGHVTAISPEADDHGGMLDGPRIVAWPSGYTARANGSEVDVLDAQGRVVATTGHRYILPGGFVGPDDRGFPRLPARVWWACGDPEPLS